MRARRSSALAALGVACMISAFAGSSRASLTPSEQVIVKELVASSQVAGAQKVRALVARPDLTPEESESALTAAVEAVPFNEARAAFLRDLLYGGASAASRNVLALATTKALVSRADALLAMADASLDQQPATLAELSKIYAFIGDALSNARVPGSPTRAHGHDPQANVSNATFDACAQSLGNHQARHPRWLKADASVSPAVAHLRAQLEVATLDMVGDNPARAIDAADRLGLTGARRAFLTELGVLLLDSGAAVDARIDRVRAVLLRLPGARADVSAVAFGDEHPSFTARGVIVGTKTELSASSAAADWFTDEIRPSPLDAPVAELARELSRLAVRRAMENRPELRLAVERDVRALGGNVARALGKPSDATPETVLTAAVSALVVDAPSAIELAMARHAANKPESAALLSDALGVLATFGVTSDGLTFPVGQTRADGSTETLQATSTRLAADGTVTSFSLDGARWEFSRSDSGIIATARKDGHDVTLATLPRARVPVLIAPTWSGDGLYLARLLGTPSAGVGGASRFRVAATTDLDAVTLTPPADDLVLEGTASVTGTGFVLLRGGAAKPQGVRGIGFAISPGSVALRAFDDSSSIDLAPATPLPADGTVKLRLSLKGNRFEATVGAVTTRGVLPPSAGHGDVVIAVRRDSSIDLTGFALRKE